ncbi:MAG TPA: dTMP kinase [Ktedonobacteraceae bacterium]|nr:dTMP kinase [Ktedonobacteraceae bacterium]
MAEKTVPDGLFIAFEGLHGCGKSTQLDLLAQRLGGEGYKVTATKEVSGTPLAEALRPIAFAASSEAWDNPLVMSLLIAATRASRVSNIIRPALRAGGVVLADRYAASMMVEQHYGGGVEKSLITTLNQHVTQGVRPHVTFLLDVTAEEAARRRQGRSSHSAWDKKPLAYHRRSRQAYQEIAAQEGWVVIDGARPSEYISGQVYTHTLQALGAIARGQHGE